jgi:hypothetical protein
MKQPIMTVYAMKTEVCICDNCKKSIASTKCDICGNDLCKGKRCMIEQYLRFDMTQGSLICKLAYCGKCKKNIRWEGELSDDIKDIIVTKINARRMLNTLEKEDKK